MVNKQEFIQVYCYSCGATKKRALQAYKETSETYKEELIKGYKEECKRNFYQD